ncbi:MAG: hypothetical protein H0T62_04535 [Parachlamydiaceae bacterium]|nr:hypothetical protein [Parachlamydiaceae bacterium]
MSITINLDSQENMTKAESFTKPLRGVLGGRELITISGEQHVPLTAIYTAWERALMGILLFTVGLPYTFIATVVLVVPPLCTSVAAYFADPVEQSSKEIVITSHEEERSPLKEDEKVKSEKNNVSQQLDEEIKTLSSEDSLMSTYEPDMVLSNSSSEEKIKEVNAEIKKENSSPIMSNQDLIKTPHVKEVRKKLDLTPDDLRAKFILNDNRKGEAISEFGNQFNLELISCKKVINANEFVSLRKALINNLEGATIFVMHDNKKCLAIPVVAREVGEEIDHKAAIFINYNFVLNKSIYAGCQLWQNLSEEASSCSLITISSHVKDESFNIFERLIKNETVEFANWNYKLKVYEEEIQNYSLSGEEEDSLSELEISSGTKTRSIGDEEHIAQSHAFQEL